MSKDVASCRAQLTKLTNNKTTFSVTKIPAVSQNISCSRLEQTFVQDGIFVCQCHQICTTDLNVCELSEINLHANKFMT